MAYTGPYFYSDTTNYYIHKHLQNIGRAAEGKALDDAELYARFAAHKEQALAASKTQYMNLMRNSMTPESMQLLNAAFEENGASIMSEINNQMSSALRESLSIDKLQQLMEIQKKTASNSIGKTLKDGKGTAAAKAFDDLLEALAKAMQLIGGPQSDDIANALLAQRYGEGVKINPGIKRMGSRLLKALSVYSKAADMTTIETQRIDQAVQTINSLAVALGKEKTSEGKDITANAIKNMIDNIFNTGFAEGVASMIDNSAQLAVNQSLIRLTGTDKTKIQITDPSGKLIGFEGTTSSGKADIQAKNVKIILESKNGVDGGEINIDIGISNKFYRTQGFSVGGKSAKGLAISSGSGGTVKEAINSLFGAPIDKYLAYNTLAKGDEELPGATASLNDLILTRQINRLFAARGGNVDFAQFILANGEIISIWELILYTERYFSGLSSTTLKKNKEVEQAITLSISGDVNRGTIIEAGHLEDTYQRVLQTNQAISKATIQAHIHVDKLRVMMK